MTKFIETVNNFVKLISGMLTLAIMGSVVFGGLWVYHQLAVYTSKPIQLPSITAPDIRMPKIEIEAPKINIPMPDLGITQGVKNLDHALDHAVDKLIGKNDPPLSSTVVFPGKDFDAQWDDNGWTFSPPGSLKAAPSAYSRP